MSRRLVRAVLAVAATMLAGCTATVTPEPATVRPSAVASPMRSASASPSASPSPVQTPGPTWPEAGLPYAGAEILEAMRSSRRPGGVPDALETAPVAEAVAQRLWTIDGTAWDTMAVSATCTSPTRCRLELAGSRAGSIGEDVWVFAVDPTMASVDVEDTALGSVPQAVARDLDELVRTLSDLDGLRLTSARWTPPPLDERFELSYRDAGEEGGCAAEILVDASNAEILDERRSGC